MSDKLDDLIESLKQERDQLKVQMHLASMDAKDEFDALEKKWNHWVAEAEAQSKPIRAVIEASAKNVGSAVDLTLDELKQGYERIKKQITADK